MRRRVYYLAEIENLSSVYKYKSSKEFNRRFMDLMNMKSETLKKFVDIFTPILKILNVLFSLIRVVVAFVASVYHALRVTSNKEIPKDEMLFLDISIFLVSRSKASCLFDESEYWVRSRCMKPVGDLSGKTVIICEDYLTPIDCVKALFLTLRDIIVYIFRFNCIYPVYKAFYYYCVYLSLEKIVKGNTILFSNQCDRWALMFDALPSKSKILLQHGLAHPSQVYRYKLKNIDIFYSISKQTWQVPYDVNLACKPELRFMNPTIDIKPIEKANFSVFLITHPIHFEIEKEIVKEVSRLNVSIYIKTHPTVRNITNYEMLCQEYGTHLVNFFPKADYAISYYSTLAFEYMAADIPVFMYEKEKDLSITDLIDDISRYKNLLKTPK